MARTKKIAVAMSGGVDSSLAALLLKEKGYEVRGITMCLGVKDAPRGKARCCGPEAVEDARRVCEKLAIPHHVMDYSSELEEQVISRFVSSYAAGTTPNPCIDCNRYLKFGTLLQRVRAMGFDYLATGHYAGVEKTGSGYRMKKAMDRRKDQTYFLYPIRREDLGSVLFPLAQLTKEEVRIKAQAAGLPVAAKPGSQDICFVGRNEHGAFVASRVTASGPGPITDRSGRILGIHSGIVHYTIGQRGGLGIASKTPLYVCAIDARENRIVVGERKDLKARGLVAVDLNLLVWPWPETVFAKIRYRKEEFPCSVSREEDRVSVTFASEQEAVAPGQAVVFYDGDVVLGGGTIEAAVQ
ncbi:MAG: tRNA 2-thiouridine(34) synthase MnmA [Thermodesulfobacteriota bacterium]